MRLLSTLFLWSAAFIVLAGNGQWNSLVTGTAINYSTSTSIGTAATDQNGKPMTIVYLENLGFQKIGQNSLADDVT